MDLLEPFGMQYASAVEVIYFIFEATVTEENSFCFKRNEIDRVS